MGAIVVDDHPMVREMLAHVVSDLDVDVVGQATNAAEALDLARAHGLRLAIIDLLLPQVDGVALTRELRRLHPDCKILGISALHEPLRVVEMMRAGATGFVFKTQPSAEVIGAIRTVLEGTPYLPPTLSADTRDMIDGDDALPLERLTARERQVYELLLEGLTNDEVGERLSIARRTVETHRQNILDKLGASSLAELYRLGVKFGLVRS